jgi:hypothetical protein
MEDAFEIRYPGLRERYEQLYAMALESFRTKINAYIRRHPQLKRLRNRLRLQARKSSTAAINAIP